MENRKDLSVFIDESGSITKTNISQNRYFIIAILLPEIARNLNDIFAKS